MQGDTKEKGTKPLVSVGGSTHPIAAQGLPEEAFCNHLFPAYHRLALLVFFSGVQIQELVSHEWHAPCLFC